MNTTTGSLLILLVLLTAQFLLTMMYYAIANSRKKVLKEIIEAGREKAGHTLDLSENPGRLVATHQYLSMILAMAITATLVLGFEPDIRRILQDAGLSTAGADVLTLVILLPPAALLLVLFGHQLPTAVISGRAEGFAVISTNIMRLLVQIFAPVMRVTQAVSQTSGIILGGTGTTIHITEEEIKTLVDAGSEDGFIEDDEKD
ncbi:MAG TPA: DUF21 domain-containing protein, partial [Aggregatilineales bacterium]|nr:DUF21 domain-containing protein [Aggregatilineales bacterium]